MTFTYTGNQTTDFAPNVDLSQLADGLWVAFVPGMPGVWGSGGTPEEALDELPGVIRDWCALP